MLWTPTAHDPSCFNVVAEVKSFYIKKEDFAALHASGIYQLSTKYVKLKLPREKSLACILYLFFLAVRVYQGCESEVQWT
jgi:beta-galactosidase/beta-glucuronidase